MEVNGSLPVERMPPDHPQRRDLNNEVHARPPEAVTPPVRASYLVLRSAPETREQDRAAMLDLLQRFDGPPVTEGTNHVRVDLGAMRVTWEAHTEFVRYTFLVGDGGAGTFDDVPIDRVPREWLAALEGEVMVATHVMLLPAPEGPFDLADIAARHFNGNELVGARLEDGYETAVTDFRIHGDRFSRLLVYDHAGGAHQTGRSMQRLLEMDTYRIMALMALPLARELVPRLEDCERELAELADALADARPEDEAQLLDRLSRLQAELSRHDTQSHTRFSAAAAYYALVQSRVRDMREERLSDLQTFREFMERRLAPAMGTCRAVSARTEALVERTGRMIQTLATRVEMTREQQTQAVLRSMNRRVELQLRLQGTVEGLSVAAISYYVVGLVGYGAAGLASAGVPVDKELVVGASVPIVVLLLAWGVRHVRHALTGGKEEGDGKGEKSA